jgi:Lar family restriction alleviation protein
MSEKAEDGLSELRKCPFCGGEPSVRDYFNNKFGAGRISCSTVGCYARMTYTGTASKKKVAEAWNRRALRSESVRAGVIEECARVCDAIWEQDAGTAGAGSSAACALAIRKLKSAPGNENAVPQAQDNAGDGSDASSQTRYKPAGTAPANEMAEMAEPEKLPPCMIPDGGDCCPQYDKLRREVEELRAELKIQDDANEILTRRLSDAGGTVRVPREPTMGQWDDFCAVHHVPFDKFIVAYKAMLSAAPSGGRNG